MNMEWKVFFSKHLRLALQLFMMGVFHYKLCVQSRMLTMTESDMCPVCGQVEIVEHALLQLSISPLTFQVG